MVEASENIDVVTMRRQSDLEASQRDYEIHATASARQTDVAALALPPSDMQAVESVPSPDPTSADAPPSSITGPRLCIAGVVVFLLILYWFTQRRK